MLNKRPMDAEKTFKVGRGGAFFMFLFVAVGGLVGGGISAWAREWAMAGMLLLGGLLSAAICVWLPGVLKLNRDGLEIQRRIASQALRWSDVRSALWAQRASGLVGMASDNWAITISTDKTKIVLSGPMVEKQQEVRALLEQRFPRSA